MGQNEKVQTLGAKVQFWKVWQRQNRPAAFPANQTVGIARGLVGEQSLQRHLADQATRWPEFEEMWSENRPRDDVACKWRFRSLEAASRSIWGRYARLSQWARRPRAVEGSSMPINRHTRWPNSLAFLSFKSGHF